MPHPSLQYLDHRPYELPEARWTWRQTWRRLAFLHWPGAAGVIQERLPEGLEVDTFEGEAWLGVVPFKMTGIAKRPLPPVPFTHEFEELNLRTYVKPTNGGPAGVWFFSLDAANWLACRTARLMFGLPYFHAAMSADERGDETIYDSRRRDAPAGIGFTGRYRPTGGVFRSSPGSLEEWLTERYCLYATHRGRLVRGDIHHEPWPLQPSEADIARNDLASGQGFTLPDIPPLVHYAERIDVIVWNITRS